MTENQKEGTSQSARAKPKLWKFLFLYGAIGWGLPSALVNMLLISVFFKDAQFAATIGQLSLLTFPLCGTAIGYVLWRMAGGTHKSSA